MEIRPGSGTLSAGASEIRSPEGVLLKQLASQLGNPVAAQILDVRSAATATQTLPPGSLPGGGQNLLSVLVALKGLQQPLSLLMQAPADQNPLQTGQTLNLRILPGKGFEILTDGRSQPSTGSNLHLSAILARSLAALMNTQTPLATPLNEIRQILATLAPSRGTVPLQQALAESLVTPKDSNNISPLRTAITQQTDSLERRLLDAAAQLRSAQANAMQNRSGDPAAAFRQLLEAAIRQRPQAAGEIPSATQARITPAAPALDAGQQRPPATAPDPVRNIKGAALLGLLEQLSSSSASAKKEPADAQWRELLERLSRELPQLLNPMDFPYQMTPARKNREAAASALDNLLKALAQIVTRTHFNQLNALQQSLPAAGTDNNALQVWLAEVPIAGKKLETVQTRIEKEAPRETRQESEHKIRWRIVLAFDFEELGPLQARMNFQAGSVSASLWAEKPELLQTLNATLPTLREGLRKWGIEVGELSVNSGSPPVPKNPIQRQIIDERA